MVDIKTDWQKIRPQVKSKFLEENAENNLEAMKAIRQIDKINDEFINTMSLLAKNLEEQKHSLEFMQAAIQSEKIQQKRAKNNKKT